jgi:hypothetical protein
LLLLLLLLVVVVVVAVAASVVVVVAHVLHGFYLIIYDTNLSYEVMCNGIAF